MAKIVIIGAGQGAGQAAASLRQEGYEGQMTILGDEAFPPYQRPPLSKQYLAGKIPLERVYVRPEKFYQDKQIELRTQTRANLINPIDKTVTTATGEVISYEKLLLATGSRPRQLNIPGNNLKNIHYLRTITDVNAIRSTMASANNLVIVGGGYIGLEVAAVAITAGLNVILLEMEARILQRVTTPEMSAYYHQFHQDRGLHILTHTTVSGFTDHNDPAEITATGTEGALDKGAGKVKQVLCRDQQGNEHKIPADIVIVGIGIVPNTELAEAAGLDCDNGIRVNDHCQTSNPDIYAIGDCANHPNPLLGRRLRLESVPNAMGAARVAATNMLGGDQVYATVPWFWSDQYDLKLQMIGFSTDGDIQITRGDKATHQFAVFYLQEGAIIAVDAVNSPREFMVCKQLYGKQIDPKLLADQKTDLKSLLPSRS